MALSTSTYYTNSIVGQMMAGVDVDVTSANSSPKYPVGQGFTRGDGNIYRYCHVGTATNAGQLVGPTTASGGATYGAAVIVPSASATAEAVEYPILPGQAGSHYVEVTISSIAANKYVGGYMCVTRGTGLGETYRIKGNTASGNPTSGALHIQLYEPLKNALLAGQGIIIVPSMFTDCTVSATTATQVTGVLCCTTTSTNLWAWVQTRGVAGCQEDGVITTVAGQQVQCSVNTAGAYMPTTLLGGTQFQSNYGGRPLVGYVITSAGAGSASNRNGVIMLQLE